MINEDMFIKCGLVSGESIGDGVCYVDKLQVHLLKETMEDEIEPYFALDDNSESPKIESIFIVDDIGYREVLPHEMRAFLDFKDQLENMDCVRTEMCFSDLKSQAEELEKCYLKLKDIFK